MGYLTTVTIYNDSVHTIKEDPKAFGEQLYDAVLTSNRESPKSRDMSFGGHVNMVNVQPSFHADAEHIMIHKGNTVVNSFEVERWIEEGRVDLADSYVSLADVVVQDLKRRIKIKEQQISGA